MVANTAATLPVTLSAQESDVLGNYKRKLQTRYEQRKEDLTYDSPHIGQEEYLPPEVEPGMYPSLEEVLNRAITLRENKLYSLIIRPETIELLEEIPEKLQSQLYPICPIIFRSNNHLHTFAELVNEDLIALVDGKIVPTPLCKRIMNTVIENWEHGQS